MNKRSIALGTFDGLHLGHIAVLRSVLGSEFSPIALTFEVPPKFNNGALGGQLIMSSEDKINCLTKMGVQPVVLDFEKIKNISPEEFLNNILKEYNPSVIATGFNFKFGKNAAGDTNLLSDFCRLNNIKYNIIPSVKYGGETISSTQIRNAIKNGNITLANAMLGRKFQFTATVIDGDKRGRTLGFPTINQVYPLNLVAPRFGVYATVTELDGVLYNSVTNVGVRPTFRSDYILSETHIFDFKGNVYGKKAKLYFADFIRDEIEFNSVDELKIAIEKDKNARITLG